MTALHNRPQEPALADLVSTQIGPPAVLSPALVVGIGASAGGLESFIAFFTNMPADSGLAFVLIQHLDPQHTSLLPELLAPHTLMPVHTITDQMRVAPNNVYLIPPNKTLTINREFLGLAPPAEAHGHRLPIDHFFQSLAADQHNHAIGIVLSGTGSDGTLGLAAILAQGGLTLAQEPDSARYDGMPQSAIARGVVDYVLPIEQMPAVLQAHVQQVIHHSGKANQDALHSATVVGLALVCNLIQEATGHDFHHYKPATLLRRIDRRMQVMRIDTLEGYIKQLRQDRHEIDSLFQDLLISVTSFFRDPAAFTTLATSVIPKLFQDKSSETPLRIWVAGCATGEEAYSIAILVREHLATLTTQPPVQIFATDIDEVALDAARQGHYNEAIVDQLSAERLASFFVQDSHGYRVTKAIRELCTFTTHNLIGDPPFVRMDLIVCRNLLIYFDADLQLRLIPLLHYALATQGYLFLGSSESVAAYPELFRTVNKDARLFQRSNGLVRPLVDFPTTNPRRRSLQRYATTRRVPIASEQQLSELLERKLLEQYTPPAVIINQQREIVFFAGRTGAYLQPPVGAASLDIMALIHPQLSIALQTAMSTTIKTQASSRREHLAVTLATGVQQITLVVQPFAEQLLLVIFQEHGPPVPVRTVRTQVASAESLNDESFAQQLTLELQTTRDALEATIDELQEANTEQALANEELLSLNEELQSTNEEVQTSKEEIQSINEELQTVNTELHRKVEELDRVNADLANLFASMQLPVVFLHADGRIARFTPTAMAVFRLIDSDVGRPITDIAPRFHGSDLNESITHVLNTLTPYELMVQRPNSQIWWMMRIRPYWTLANVIDGVVLMFVDITELKHAELEQERLLVAVQQARSDAERIVETVRGPLLILDPHLRVQSANRSFYQMFQTTAAETEQRLIYELGERHWDIPQLRVLLGEQLDPATEFQDIKVRQEFPTIGIRTLLLNARQLQHMPNRELLLLIAIEDISERTEMATVLQQAHDELEQRVQSRTSELAQMNTALQSEINEHQQAEQARQLLLRQLVTAQEEERRRIARELHDQMGQDLTVLMLGLKAIRDAAPKNSAMHERIEPLQKLATQIGREVRTLALQLRPPALDDLGLVATVSNLVEQWSAQVLIAVDFHTSGLEQERLPWSIETALYRLVQEALTNVLKHAKATSVNLIIDRRADAVHMIVEDDGVGFDVAVIRQSAHIEHRLGLIGMHERVAQLGGTLTIESALNGGTSIFVRLPLAAYATV